MAEKKPAQATIEQFEEIENAIKPVLTSDTVGTVTINDAEHDIFLVPTPSSDPRDPLNLPKWRKILFIVLVSLCRSPVQKLERMRNYMLIAAARCFQFQVSVWHSYQASGVCSASTSMITLRVSSHLLQTSEMADVEIRRCIIRRHHRPSDLPKHVHGSRKPRFHASSNVHRPASNLPSILHDARGSFDRCSICQDI